MTSHGVMPTETTGSWWEGPGVASGGIGLWWAVLTKGGCGWHGVMLTEMTGPWWEGPGVAGGGTGSWWEVLTAGGWEGGGHGVMLTEPGYCSGGSQ